MQAQVIQLQGMTFTAKADTNHWVMMDGPSEFGGSSAAPRPMELILFGFCGCAGSDIASILAKKRVNLERFEIRADAEQADEYPKVFKKIHLTFVFTGKDIQAKDVERAIELTRTKYCPAWAMLRDSVEITHAYQIENSA